MGLHLPYQPFHAECGDPRSATAQLWFIPWFIFKDRCQKPLKPQPGSSSPLKELSFEPFMPG